MPVHVSSLLTFVIAHVAFEPGHVNGVLASFVNLEVALLFALIVASSHITIVPPDVDIVFVCFMALEVAIVALRFVWA